MAASDRNLNMSLQILKWFHIKSGLKINITKTKVIRIGNIRESDRRFGRENNLDWVTKFTVLGIEYDVLTMENITNANISVKLDSMKHIFNAWSCRNITPIGRVTILKSLVLSKITHVLLTLPSPDNDTIKILDNLSYNFIWKNKRHEVSKKTITKEIKAGGLKMLNIKKFDGSLKITWLRRLLNDTPEWEEFANHYRVNRLLLSETNYHNLIKNKISRAIPRDWDRIMQTNRRNYNMSKPLVIEWITKDKKGGTR